MTIIKSVRTPRQECFGLAVAVLTLCCIPAAHAEMQGNVHINDGRRLSRPMRAAVCTEGMAGCSGAGPRLAGSLLGTDSFLIKEYPKALMTEAVSFAESVPEVSSALAIEDQTVSLPATQKAVDYAAIEKAYEEAVPPRPVPGSVPAADVPAQVAAGQLAAGREATAAAVAALNAHLAIAANPELARVDLDNCQCGTPMPSQACINSRTSAIYSSSYPTAQSVVRQVVSSPTVSLPNLVLPSIARR